MPSSTRPTRASLARLLSLAWPLIVSQSIWTLQIVLDRIFLSRHDTDSVARSHEHLGGEAPHQPVLLDDEVAAEVASVEGEADAWKARIGLVLGREHGR